MYDIIKQVSCPVYYGKAPTGTKAPFVIFNLLTSKPSNTICLTEFDLMQDIYQIDIYTRGIKDNHKILAELCNYLNLGSTKGYQILIRNQTFSRDEYYRCMLDVSVWNKT